MLTPKTTPLPLTSPPPAPTQPSKLTSPAAINLDLIEPLFSTPPTSPQAFLNSLKDLPPATTNPPPPRPLFDTIKRLANEPPPIPPIDLSIPSPTSDMEPPIYHSTQYSKNTASSTAASPAVESFMNSSEMLENQENNKSKSDKGYHAVPPPFTGNFIPFKPDLTFMDEIVKSENMDVITIVTPSNVEPKTVRKNSFRPLVIKDWNFDDESEVEIISKDKTVSSSTEKIKFVKSARETVEKQTRIVFSIKKVHTVRVKDTTAKDRAVVSENKEKGFETTSKQSNDPPLSRGYTLGSGEDSMKLLELMELCTKLLNLDSLIEQFWQTTSASTLEIGEMEITATIDGNVKVVSEASIRRHLKLEDSDGISTY
ncbi:hypothetical protein Tco_0200005 [Tanacetum coccineum]